MAKLLGDFVTSYKISLGFEITQIGWSIALLISERWPYAWMLIQ